MHHLLSTWIGIFPDKVSIIESQLQLLLSKEQQLLHKRSSVISNEQPSKRQVTNKRQPGMFYFSIL